jgi:BlaI family transcriptional regulator, penicillinase repressor
MARPGSETLTPREAQIMEVLWNAGSATAEQIRSDLPGESHDSTVRTLLRVLEDKGYVRHTAKGKAYVYAPAIKRASAERKAVRSIVQRFFGGSAEALVMRLLEDDQLTPEQLDDLRKQLDSREKQAGR